MPYVISLGKSVTSISTDIINLVSSLEEHQEHVKQIMEALRKERLYCNARKSEFFKYELKFLGHRISLRGIEPDNSKVARILDWAVPRTAGEVRAFLGLVRYLASFLQNLAEFTSILTPLTGAKNAVAIKWTEDHQTAFDAIKKLVVSR